MITLAYLAHANQQQSPIRKQNAHIGSSMKRSSASLTRPYLPSTSDADCSFSSTSTTETASTSAYSRNTNGSNLAELIFDGYWDEATAHIIANGRDARKKIIAPRFMNRNHDSEVLPIHYALSRVDVPITFLEALIFAYPESLEKRELTYKRTCLHIALKSLVPDEIVSFLLSKNPHAASMTDSMGRVPLHYALSNMPRSPEILRELIKCCPGTLLAQDDDGWSPLHGALRNNSYGGSYRFEVIRMLISMTPETVLQRSWSFDSKRRTPLGLALHSTKGEDRERIVRFIHVAMQTYVNTPLFQNFNKAERTRKNIRRAMVDACYV